MEDLDLAPGEKRILRDLRYTKEHGFPLHVAIRRLREPNDDNDDSWFLLTNLDLEEHALGYYEKRFWIKEMFRDFKNARNGFEQHQIQSEEIFEKLLLVLSLTHLMILEVGQYRLDRMNLRKILPKRRKSGRHYCVFQLNRQALRKVLLDAPDDVWEALRQVWSLVEA